MNFLKKLSTLTVVLLTTTTFANAATTDVIATEINNTQHFNVETLMKNVEVNLEQSMHEVKISLTGNTLNNQKVLVAKTTVTDVNKLADIKQVMNAE